MMLSRWRLRWTCNRQSFNTANTRHRSSTRFRAAEIPRYTVLAQLFHVPSGEKVTLNPEQAEVKGFGKSATFGFSPSPSARRRQIVHVAKQRVQPFAAGIRD